MMQKPYRFFFLLVLIFAVSCDEIGGGENVVDDGGPTIVDFSASPTTIDPGGSATLLWNVNGATSITIDNGVGDVTSDEDARFTVNPVQTTTYTLTATNAEGDDQAQTRVTVSGDTPPAPPPGGDTAAPTGDFGVSDSQTGPFQNDKPNDITSPNDERIVAVAPGGTFYARVAYSDPSGVTDIAINLVSSNPPDIAGELDPTQQFFTLGEPVGGCTLSSTQVEVTCVYPITVSDDAVNITELPNSGGEFAYVFRTLVTDGAGNQSEEFIRGYVIVDGDGGGNPPNPPTNPPANEDPDVSIEEVDDLTLEDGSASTNLEASVDDDENDTFSYQWSVTSGNADNVDFASPTTEDTGVTFSAADNYTLQLVVTDTNDSSSTGSDTVAVTVSSDNTNPPSNPAAPVIDSFDATPNPASEGEEVTLSWTLSGGDATTLTVTDLETNQNRDVTGEDSTEVTAVSTRSFRLTATNGGGSNTDTVEVTVNPSNPNPPANQDPVAAFTSQQQEGTLEVQYNASTSDDPDGEIVSYNWDFGDGTSGNARVFTRTYQEAGEYTVVLIVEDDDGATDSETKTVTVAPSSIPPTADFSVSPEEPSVGNTVTLNGAGSDDPDGDNNSLTYAWSLTPPNGSTATLSATDTVSPTFVVDASGDYEVSLTVTDEDSEPSESPATKTIMVGNGSSPTGGSDAGID